MNFEDTAGEILDLGAELRAAVSDDRSEAVAGLLARRESALRTLGRLYSSLPPADLAATSGTVARLRADDTELQEFFRNTLYEVGESLQKARARSRHDDEYTDPQCLDRRA